MAKKTAKRYDAQEKVELLKVYNEARAKGEKGKTLFETMKKGGYGGSTLQACEIMLGVKSKTPSLDGSDAPSTTTAPTAPASTATASTATAPASTSAAPTGKARALFDQIKRLEQKRVQLETGLNGVDADLKRAFAELDSL